MLRHKRFGHLREKNLKLLLSKQMVKVLEVNPSREVTPDCHGCTEEKQHHDSFEEKDQHKKWNKLEFVERCQPCNLGEQFLRTDSHGWCHQESLGLLHEAEVRCSWHLSRVEDVGWKREWEASQDPQIWQWKRIHFKIVQAIPQKWGHQIVVDCQHEKQF